MNILEEFDILKFAFLKANFQQTVFIMRYKD